MVKEMLLYLILGFQFSVSLSYINGIYINMAYGSKNKNDSLLYLIHVVRGSDARCI